jgi:hypothetical protein
MSAEYETSGKCISEKLHQNKKQGYWLLSTVHEYSRREKESQRHTQRMQKSRLPWKEGDKVGDYSLNFMFRLKSCHQK